MYKSFRVYVACLFLATLFLAARSVEAADPYAIISEKNLFRPDRKEWIIEKPDAKMVDKKIDTSKLELFGTIIVGDKKGALIHDKQAKKEEKRTNIYSLGDYIGGYVISAIDEKRVVLDYYGEKVTLSLHEGKENSKLSSLQPLPPEEKPKSEPPKPKQEAKQEQKNQMQEMLASGKIPEALAKSPFLSEDNMKKILEFNKEVMEEMKGSGGTLDQESIKDKVEQFREKFMDQMGKAPGQ